MKSLDRLKLYDIVYALVARDGRERALFGNCALAAREAFERSLAGEPFPELWFELPLASEPWLDLHSVVFHRDVAGSRATYAGHEGVYADALAWFETQQPGVVRQLVLSYDTSVGDVEAPAMQLLMYGRDNNVPLAFLEAVGRADLHGAFSGFVERMPAAWYPCYVGTFPGREGACAGAKGGAWVRIECIVGDERQREYALDEAQIRRDLAFVGLRDVGDDAIDGIRELARSPFPLELQFNAGADGVALPTISASVRFQPADWVMGDRQQAIGRLAGWMQARELADERCGLLAQTAFAKRVSHADEAAVLSCFPAFVKLRYRRGAPTVAKAYLMVQVAPN